MAIFFGSTEQIYWTQNCNHMTARSGDFVESCWPHINSLFIYLFLLLIVHWHLCIFYCLQDDPFSAIEHACNGTEFLYNSLSNLIFFNGVWMQTVPNTRNGTEFLYNSLSNLIFFNKVWTQTVPNTLDLKLKLELDLEL